LLAAQTLGYGACWMVEPVVYAQKEIENLLNIKNPLNFISLIPIGKPVKPRKCSARKSAGEIYSIIK